MALNSQKKSYSKYTNCIECSVFHYAMCTVSNTHRSSTVEERVLSKRSIK